MKYIAVIDTDDYENFEFFEDGIGKYLVGKDAGATSSGGWIPLYFKEAPEPREIEKYSTPIELGYNLALTDCRVLEE